jgi:hypothetical protein
MRYSMEKALILQRIEKARASLKNSFMKYEHSFASLAIMLEEEHYFPEKIIKDLEEIENFILFMNKLEQS